LLDIGIGDERGKPPDAAEPGLALDDDGYYWFLHPLFEQLHAESGQYIDLYGDASFSGPGLDALERMLTRARRLIEAQPDTWRVRTATQLAPVRCDIHKPVKRKEFMRLIGLWEQVVDRARATGRAVLCFGD
jgi:hypothetical protein